MLLVKIMSSTKEDLEVTMSIKTTNYSNIIFLVILLLLLEVLNMLSRLFKLM